MAEIDDEKTELSRLKDVAAADWKVFLESTPPNVPKNFPMLLGHYHSADPGMTPLSSNSNPVSIRMPRLKLFCEQAQRVHPFFPDPDFLFPFHRFVFVHYKCETCGGEYKVIAVRMEPNVKTMSVEVIKLGEYPPFVAPGSQRRGTAAEQSRLGGSSK